jgi:hypothetical protein
MKKATAWNREIRSRSRFGYPSLPTSKASELLKPGVHPHRHRLVQSDTHNPFLSLLIPMTPSYAPRYLLSPSGTFSPKTSKLSNCVCKLLHIGLHQHANAQASQPYHSGSTFLEAKLHMSLIIGRYVVAANKVVIRDLVCVRDSSPMWRLPQWSPNLSVAG